MDNSTNSSPNAGDPGAVSVAVKAPQAVAPEYGGQVPAKDPRQDMYQIDELAGGPIDDRRGDPAEFTAGDKEQGLGGNAIGIQPGVVEGNAVLGEPIGI